jgi:hypothetical protein
MDDHRLPSDLGPYREAVRAACREAGVPEEDDPQTEAARLDQAAAMLREAMVVAARNGYLFRAAARDSSQGEK